MLIGVLADFSYSFTAIAKSMGLCDNVFSDTEQKVWDYPFDDKIVWQEWKSFYNPWMTLQPLVSSFEIDYLNEVIDFNDVYFITARSRTKGLSAELQTRYWLESIGVNVTHTTVIATKQKGKICKGLDIDMGLDDKIANVLDIMDNGVNCYVRKLPHNDGHDLLEYVDTVGQFLRKAL